jgi:hypothetical protein
MVGRLHGPVGPSGLRGRAKECAVLDALTAAVRRGVLAARRTQASFVADHASFAVDMLAVTPGPKTILRPAVAARRSSDDRFPRATGQVGRGVC